MTPNYKKKFKIFSMALGCSLAAMTTPAEAVILDLTTVMDGTINGAMYVTDSTQPAGTGVLNDVFLRVQAHGNSTTEVGFNTSVNGVLDNVPGPFTKAVLFSSVNKVEISGEEYVPILLDVNEGVTSINLDELLIFKSSTGALDFPSIGDLAADMATTLLYSLDAGEDSTVILDGTGSGVADMVVFVSVDNFAGVTEDDYFVLASAFSGVDGGFEEWSLVAGEGLDPLIPDPIPEPNVSMLGALGLLLILRKRNR